MLLRLAYLVFKIYVFIFRPVHTGVRIVMIRGKEVLLVRQSYMPGWFMPGGGVKRCETLEAAARREAMEEVGASLGTLRLMGTYTNFAEWKTDHNIVFVADTFALSGRSDHEVVEIRFFPLDQLPEGLWPGHRRRLEEFRAGIQSPTYGEW